MSDQTARFALPFIAPGQAQKEVFHNEALARIDAALHACVVAAGMDAPPAVPAIGASWITGDSPIGAWAGQPRTLACWSEGGWRFVAPVDGMTVWLVGDSLPLSYVDGIWRTGDVRASALTIGGLQVVGERRPAIASPTGGAVADVEARTARSAVIAALSAHGLIAL